MTDNNLHPALKCLIQRQNLQYNIKENEKIMSEHRMQIRILGQTNGKLNSTIKHIQVQMDKEILKMNKKSK